MILRKNYILAFPHKIKLFWRKYRLFYLVTLTTLLLLNTLLSGTTRCQVLKIKETKEAKKRHDLISIKVEDPGDGDLVGVARNMRILMLNHCQKYKKQPHLYQVKTEGKYLIYQFYCY